VLQNSGTESWTDEAGCEALVVKTGFASLEALFHTSDVRRVLEVLRARNLVNRGRHDCGVDSSQLCLMKMVPKSLVGRNPLPGCGCGRRFLVPLVGKSGGQWHQCKETREIAANPASEELPAGPDEHHRRNPAPSYRD
jgi:hypothetical protein